MSSFKRPTVGHRRPGDSFQHLCDCLLCSKLPQNSEAPNSMHRASQVSVGQASGHSSPGTQSTVAHDGDVEEMRSCPQVPPGVPRCPRPWVFTAHYLSAPACGAPGGTDSQGRCRVPTNTCDQEASQRRKLGLGPGNELHGTP